MPKVRGMAFGTTWVTDINTDPGCSGTMDPDMALCHSQGSDVTMDSGDSSGHLVQHGHHGNVTLGHQADLKWLPRPLAWA